MRLASKVVIISGAAFGMGAADPIGAAPMAVFGATSPLARVSTLLAVLCLGLLPVAFRLR